MSESTTSPFEAGRIRPAPRAPGFSPFAPRLEPFQPGVLEDLHDDEPTETMDRPDDDGEGGPGPG